MISDRLRLSGDYVRNLRGRTKAIDGWALPTVNFANPRFNQGSHLQLTDTVSPTMVVTTQLGFTEHDFYFIPTPGAPSQFNDTQLGFPASLVTQQQAQLFPSISMTNYQAFGITSDSHDTSTNYYFTVSASKLVKTHALKFGGEFRVILDNTPAYSAMAFSFSPVFTQQNYVNASAASGNAFASFLMGNPSGGSATINAMPAYGNHYYGVYLQDDWRVTRSLTLNLGVRWDYDSPMTERYNRMTQGFDPTSPSNFVVPGLPLTGGLLFTSPKNRLANPRDLNNIQPRLGLAWHFLPKTVLRAGFGLSYLPLFVAGGNEGFTLTTPVIGSLNANATPYNQLSVNPFPSGILQTETGGLGTNVGQAITFVNQKRVIPYVYQYSFGFQHELPGQAVLDVSYVGSQTRKQGVSKNIDVLATAQLALGTAFLNTAVTPDPFAGLLPGLAMNTSVLERQMLLPYPQFTSVTQNQIPIGHSWYNSLQVILTKRLSHGLHFLASFSYSEMMTAASFLNPQFSNDQLERVRVPDDEPFRLTVNFGYELPFFKGAKGFKHSLLGGWQIQAIALMMSGAATWRGGRISDRGGPVHFEPGGA